LIDANSDTALREAFFANLNENINDEKREKTTKKNRLRGINRKFALFEGVYV
jgi:hypothetical protein